MKKVLFAYGALIAVVLILGVLKFSGGFEALLPGNSSSSPYKVKINNKTYEVKLAKTAEEQQKGLSEIKSLPSDEGMLFIFEQKGRYAFWMRNTYIPLDIIHINDDKIVQIFSNVPAQGDNQGDIPTYPPDHDANYVLEINGGEAAKNNIKVGDTVKLEGI